MSRPVIPPSKRKESPSKKHTINALGNRISAAEVDAKQLIDQLTSMGYGQSQGGSPQQNGHDCEDVCDNSQAVTKGPITPYKVRIAGEMGNSQDNYEELVSRMCKTESAIQTLKLNLLNIKGQKDLKSKAPDENEEKLVSLRDACEKEISNSKKALKEAQEDLKQETHAREKLEEEIKELREALTEASTTRAEAANSVEVMTSNTSKLQRKMNEIREELEREKSLRSSLEDSQNTLLGRVREMEEMVEQERNQVKSLHTDCTTLRNDSIKVREELGREQSRRQELETSLSKVTQELDQFHLKCDNSECDKQMLVTELSRLRKQYDDLIKQLEQTQVIVDQQKANNKGLKEENEHLSKIVKSCNEEKVKIREMHKTELEAERARAADKENIEAEALQYKLQLKDINSQNDAFRKKIAVLEKELNTLSKRHMSKDEEYNKVADGMQKELSSLKHQLQIMQKERDRAMKDKENLLEEVNQTVDSMVSERSKLNAEIQQLKQELDIKSRSSKTLEHENSTLLERVQNLEQYKEANNRIDKTMKEMMEQKNKLAYENGRLQSQLTEVTQQLDSLRQAHSDATLNRNTHEILQIRYDKAQKEITELKAALERQESWYLEHKGNYETRNLDYDEIKKVRDDIIKENSMLLDQLRETEERENRKVGGLQKSLADAKKVNKEIASTLEAVMSSHSQLQTVVENLQIDLGKKDSLISQLKMDKNKSQEEWKIELRTFEERMENLREELRKERERSYKKTTKDIADIKKQSDNLQSRNMELVKANTELRHKGTELELTVKDLKDKLADQKRKNDYLIKSRKNLEENLDKYKELQGEVEDLERLRDEYMKRNQEQGDMITSFMNQISMLQEELRNLADSQSQSESMSREHEEMLERERLYCEEAKRKFKVLDLKSREAKKEKEEVESLRREVEDKLKHAKNESAEISIHLQDAHEWFKSKFDHLQRELCSSKKRQTELEQENQEQQKLLVEEQMRSKSATEKAKEMIKASRQTISKLADYSEIADHETKQTVGRLQKELQKERDHARYIETKFEKYKEASARHLQQLLKDMGS